MHRHLIDLPSPNPSILRYAMSLRGDTNEPYGSFNACHYVGDNTTHVTASRLELARHLSISPESIVIPRQTHSSNVATISAISDIAVEYNDVDALVTNLPNIALCINTADCVPIIMADVVNHVIGIAHSGWRGTVNKIAEKALSAMVAIGAQPNNIHALLGAHICADCFEVGTEVAQQFRDTFPNDINRIVLTGYHKPHISLSNAIQTSLITAGVPSANINDIGMCSHCGKTSLFSARRDGIKSGRTLTSAMLIK